MGAQPFPVLAEEITADWLTGVLGGTVDEVVLSQVGTGQIGTCYRLELTGPDVGTRLPERLIAKLPAIESSAREIVAGSYRTEVRFYRDLAPTVDIRVPRCHHVELAENGDFVLLLEDLAPAQQGDQIAGCTPAQTRDAAVNLAGLHGPRWCDPTLLDHEGLQLNGPDDAALLMEFYAPAITTFLDGLGDRLAPADRELLVSLGDVFGGWVIGRPERFGLVHGDYRVDNLLFPPGGAPGCVAVDWQTLSLALPARDLGYLIATSLEPDVRREHERDLVAAYHGALGPVVTDGYSVEECFDDYVFGLLQVPLVVVFGMAYSTRTDRGDEMFLTMIRRGCAAMRELDSLSLLGTD